MSKKKSLEKNSVWPTSFISADTEIPGSLSPIPILCVTGTFGSGKTTFAFQIDPVQKGKPTRTLLFDLEKGSNVYSLQYEVERIDLMQHLEDNHPDWRPAKLWSEWLRIATEKTATGQFTNLVVDTGYPLQDGAFEYVKQNAKQFGVFSPDSRLIWGAVKNYMRSEFGKLASRVQTLTFVMHLKNKYDSETKQSTHVKEMQGIDVFMQLATLVIHLHRDPNQKVSIRGKQYPACPKYPYPCGTVIKSRLSWTDFENRDEFGDPSIRPLLPDFMPVCTPGVIRGYLSKPVVAFKEEESRPEQVPGMDEILTDDQRRELDVRKAESELVLRAEQRKQELVRDLVSEKLYPDMKAVGAAVAALGLVYSLDTHDQFVQKLREYAKQPA